MYSPPIKSESLSFVIATYLSQLSQAMHTKNHILVLQLLNPNLSIKFQIIQLPRELWTFLRTTENFPTREIDSNMSDCFNLQSEVLTDPSEIRLRVLPPSTKILTTLTSQTPL